MLTQASLLPIFLRTAVNSPRKASDTPSPVTNASLTVEKSAPGASLTVITEDALELIAAMPDNLDLRCQVLLGNLSDQQIKSWHWDVQQITYGHPLTNFTEANINEFFAGAFSHMSKKYDFGITSEVDFLAGYQQDIQAVKADLVIDPNVAAVGRKVGSWFKKFNEDLIAAEE